MIEYSSLLELLTCPACSQVVSLPVSQCRKGHLYCSNCRTNNSCRICKQTFSEAPNIALEKIINCIALPCKYRSSPTIIILATKPVSFLQPPWLPLLSVPAQQVTA